MKRIGEKGRKECPICGAHRIILFPAEDTCPVCGNSLESVPVFGKKCGNLMFGIGHAQPAIATLISAPRHGSGCHGLKAACK